MLNTCSKGERKYLASWLQANFRYNAKTGNFHGKGISGCHTPKNEIAGHIRKDRNLRYMKLPRGSNKRSVPVRDIVWLLHHGGRWPTHGRLTHKDGNTLNTCIDNLEFKPIVSRPSQARRRQRRIDLAESKQAWSELKHIVGDTE